MRPPHSRRALVALAVLSLGAGGVGPLGAQEVGSMRAARAFQPSVTPYLGMTSFGDRFTDPGGAYRYSSSLTAGARADWPLTRRSGVLMDLALAPITGQSVEDQNGDRLIGGRVLAWRATLGLGWRFKPGAPVFLSVGAGVLGATKPPAPESSGSQIEPEATYAIGYDARRLGPWNVWAVYAGHIVKPADPERPAASTKSRAYDWTFSLGLRYILGARDGQGTP